MERERFRVRIAGIGYPNDDGSSREEIIRRCEKDEELILRHTPVRQDKNAIRILRQNGEQLGWIPREWTKYVVYYLDRGTKMEATIKSYALAINRPISADIYITKPEEPAEKAPIAEPVKVLSKKTCGICGASIGAEVNKCPDCGKSICVNCGNPIGQGVDKCPKCGQSTPMGSIQALGTFYFILGIIIIAVVVFVTMC